MFRSITHFHPRRFGKTSAINNVIWAVLIVLLLVRSNDGVEKETLACDREMRRTIEAIQAWRRTHNGSYPGRLVDLKDAGLLPSDGGICPSVRAELRGASPTHGGITSRRDGGDPPGTYEYELSDIPIFLEDLDYLPKDPPKYTRQDLKAVLLRREFWEQVPILRCSSHRTVTADGFNIRGGTMRNATTSGLTYWSGSDWESNWVDDVPYCERSANVLFGLKGPPFYADVSPVISQALDLRKWSCAFGDHSWWWTYPIFVPAPQYRVAAHLRPFFDERHGRVLIVGGEEWWINGLVQLQGRLIPKGANFYSGPSRIAFAWQKTNAVVNRKFSTASWLQGSVWPAPKGDIVGWLVWNYADQSFEKSPIVFGINTERFWAEPSEIPREKDFPQPVWTFDESAEAAGRARTLSLYRQVWQNPRPNDLVSHVDFVSNSNSPASPFLIAINVR